MCAKSRFLQNKFVIRQCYLIHNPTHMLIYRIEKWEWRETGSHIFLEQN